MHSLKHKKAKFHSQGSHHAAEDVTKHYQSVVVHQRVQLPEQEIKKLVYQSELGRKRSRLMSQSREELEGGSEEESKESSRRSSPEDAN